MFLCLCAWSVCLVASLALAYLLCNCFFLFAFSFLLNCRSKEVVSNPSELSLVLTPTIEHRVCHSVGGTCSHMVFKMNNLYFPFNLWLPCSPCCSTPQTCSLRLLQLKLAISSVCRGLYNNWRNAKRFTSSCSPWLVGWPVWRDGWKDGWILSRRMEVGLQKKPLNFGVDPYNSGVLPEFKQYIWFLAGVHALLSDILACTESTSFASFFFNQCDL